jgi:hypothetical protein
MSERGEAKRDGANLQKNSGRGSHEKGDAKWNGFLVDYKEFAKSFSLNKDVWAKISTDAWRTDPDLDPAIKLILGEGGSKIRLAVIEWSRLEELVEKEWMYDDLADS